MDIKQNIKDELKIYLQNELEKNKIFYYFDMNINTKNTTEYLDEIVYDIIDSQIDSLNDKLRNDIANIIEEVLQDFTQYEKIKIINDVQSIYYQK